MSSPPRFTLIPFAQAKAYVMSFGKHNGRTLDDIATSDDGLLYLDWLRGLGRNLDFHTSNAVNSYLEDPTIAKDLAELVSKRGR